MDDEITELKERNSVVGFSRRKQKSPRGAVQRSFAAQLDHAMGAQRYTPESLSAMAGISATSVRNYLLGQFLPRHNIVEALERVLNVRFELRDPSVTEAQPMPAADEATVPSDKPALSNTPSAIPLHLSIGEAKLALARSFGVSPDDIQIIVRG